MIDAVIIFALINIGFELTILGMLPIHLRLIVLGTRNIQVLVHLIIMVFVLAVHWGTVLGTMGGFLSFTLSILTIRIAQLLWGYIRTIDDVGIYHRGIIKYYEEELT